MGPNRAPAIKNLGAQTEIRWPEHVVNAESLKNFGALRAYDLKNRVPFENFGSQWPLGPASFEP